MLLTQFRVTEFRSVQDSGWIDVEQITALIGTNGSGKKNIMIPLGNSILRSKTKLIYKTIYRTTNFMFIAIHHKNQFLFVPNTH